LHNLDGCTIFSTPFGGLGRARPPSSYAYEGNHENNVCCTFQSLTLNYSVGDMTATRCHRFVRQKM